MQRMTIKLKKKSSKCKASKSSSENENSSHLNTSSLKASAMRCPNPFKADGSGIYSSSDSLKKELEEYLAPEEFPSTADPQSNSLADENPANINKPIEISQEKTSQVLKPSIKKSAQEILFKSICIICSNPAEIFLKCKHEYCRSCSKNLIKKECEGKLVLLTEEELNNKHIVCIICNQWVGKNNYQNIIKPELDKLKNEYRNFRCCLDCNRVKEIAKFYNDKCKECATFDIRSGLISDDKSKKFLEEKRTCHGCKEQRTFVSDCLMAVCDLDHYHCNRCLEKCLEMESCLKCRVSSSLSDEIIERIARVLIRQCTICKISLWWESFMPRSCCGGDVCTDCQISAPNYNCKLCGKTQLLKCSKFIRQDQQDGL